MLSQRLLNTITIAGMLPLLLISVLPKELFLTVQLTALSYVAIVMAFIAGFHWYEGIVKDKFDRIYSAVIFSMLPWFVLLFFQLGLPEKLSWILMTALVLIICLFDYIWPYSIERLNKLRAVGTLSLLIPIFIILARLYL